MTNLRGILINRGDFMSLFLQL